MEIEELVQRMGQHGVYASLDVAGGIALDGYRASEWQEAIQGRESELRTYLDGQPPEPSEEDQSEYISGLMDQYGIGPAWTSRELDEASISVRYLVDDVLVEGQHAVIAGAQKSLKTSIGIDLALSLSGPVRFLGRFWVPDAKRVLFLSAESGEGTIQETARRVASAKGLPLAECDKVAWGFWVPRAKNEEQLAILDFQIDQCGAEVVIIDPLYQVLSGEDQANLSLNGEQLQAIVQRCKRRGATTIMVDHAKRSSGNVMNYQPLELQDVSGAGKAEFFRQWLLIGRRERFDPEKPYHRLWMTIGGSAGHCGLYAVDVDESREDASGERRWAVSVANGSTAREADRVDRAARTAAKKEAEAAKKLEANVQKIRDSFNKPHEAWTKTNIRDHAGLNTNTVGPAVARLVQLGEMEPAKVRTATGTYDGYRWTRMAEINRP